MLSGSFTTGGNIRNIAAKAVYQDLGRAAKGEQVAGS
jgi:hypothetical protein